MSDMQKDYVEFITRAEFEPFRKRHNDMYNALFGEPGKPGYDEVIRNILQWIELREKAAERRREWWNRLQWVIIPILVASFLAFLGQAIVFWVRIYPNLTP